MDGNRRLGGTCCAPSGTAGRPWQQLYQRHVQGEGPGPQSLPQEPSSATGPSETHTAVPPQPHVRMPQVATSHSPSESWERGHHDPQPGVGAACCRQHCPGTPCGTDRPCVPRWRNGQWLKRTKSISPALPTRLSLLGKQMDRVPRNKNPGGHCSMPPQRPGTGEHVRRGTRRRGHCSTGEDTALPARDSPCHAPGGCWCPGCRASPAAAVLPPAPAAAAPPPPPARPAAAPAPAPPAQHGCIRTLPRPRWQ